MFVKLAQFLSIMLYVLVAGVMWGPWLSLGRTMTRYDATTFLSDGRHMIANLASVMAVLMTVGRGPHRQQGQDMDARDLTVGLEGYPGAVGGLPHAVHVPIADGRRRDCRCCSHDPVGRRLGRSSCQPATDD
ncbi:MAG: hypothetical protein ABJA86_07710 [Nocardioidaceae bacterium]